MHRCQADGCDVFVAPKRYVCQRHWRMLPTSLRRPLWSAGKSGQEVDPSIVAECLEHIRARESRSTSCPICQENRCCPKHGRHVVPHVGCILR